MRVKYVVRTEYGEFNVGVFDTIKEADYEACLHIITNRPIAYQYYLDDMEAFKAYFEEEHARLQQKNKGLVFEQFGYDSVYIDELGFDDDDNLVMVCGLDLDDYLQSTFGAEDAEKERQNFIDFFLRSSYW